MRRIRLHRDFMQRFAVFVGVVLIVFSFQANYELADSKIYYFAYYFTLFMSFATLLYWKISRFAVIITLVILSVGVVVVGPGKALGMILSISFGYYAMKHCKVQIEIALVCVFFFNFVLVFAQFIGWSDAVYQYCHYNNAVMYRSFIDRGLGFSGFLPQFRPSGIFPSPTYITAFSVLFFAAVLSTHYYRNRFVFFLFGMHMSMIGSTAGLSLALISIPLLRINMRLSFLILGYIIMMVAYATYLPDTYFYNFNYGNFGTSYYSRFDVTNSFGESVLQQNIVIFSLMCLALFMGMFKLRKIETFLYLIPFGIALMLPALVHNIALSLFYWFLVGVAFGRLTLEEHWHHAIENKWSRLSFRKAASKNVVPR